MNSIAVEQLTRTFRIKGKEPKMIVACDNLSFEVRRSEIFGLLGPNGAGKSTLVHQLTGLMLPTSGRIWLEGIDVVKQPEQVKPLIGFLPQSGLAMRFTEVERAFHYTGRLRGQSELEARRQTRELLTDLGLSEYARRPISKLSGGLRRLANFGMALMGYPRFLVLDEPTNELDPSNRKLIWDIIVRLNQEQGVTCVLVTHNVLEAEKVIQRVAVMQTGKIIALGTPGELKAQTNRGVRLEIILKEGLTLTETQRTDLSELGSIEEVRTGQYRLYLPPEAVTRATDWIVTQLGLTQLDDFRLAPPSLEDVYIELNQSAAGKTYPREKKEEVA
jgi:ABC-type multidrug transport system ATPase subunit